MNSDSAVLRFARALGRVSGMVVTALAIVAELARPGPAPGE